MITAVPIVGAVTEVSSFDSGTAYIPGLDWYGNRIWAPVTSPLDEVWVFYENGTLERTINVSTITDPLDVAHDGTDLWIFSSTDDRVYRVNATDGTVIDSFASVDRWSLTYDGTNYLWTVNTVTGRIQQIDKAGNLISEFAAPTPDVGNIGHNVSAGGIPYVFGVDGVTGKMYKMTETGTVVAVFETWFIAPNGPRGIGDDGSGYFWVGREGTPVIIYQIDLGLIEVTKTYITTDKGTYLRGETVTLDWYIVNYDPNKRYYYEIWKKGAVVFSEHKEYVNRSNTDTWVAAMEGLYVADIQQERFLYPDLKLASTEFTVLSSNVTPEGDITVAPSTITKGESVTVTYNLTVAGKIMVYDTVMGTVIYDDDVASGTLVTRTYRMNTAGNYTADLSGYVFDRVELVDSAAFVVTETADHPPYIYVDKLVYMLGDTIKVKGYTNVTGSTLYLEKVPLANATSEFLIYQEDPVPLDQVFYRSIVIPKNAPYGSYRANLSGLTFKHDMFDISGDKDNYVFWLSNTFYLKDGTSTLIYRQHHIRDVVIIVGYSDFGADELNRTYAEIHRTDLRANEKTYSDIAVLTDRVGLYKVTMYKSRFLFGGMLFDPINLITFDICRVVIDVLAPVEVSLIEQVTNPLERIFGEDLGKGIFAFLVIAAIVGVMALEGAPTAPTTMVAIGLVLMFSWMGWLPLYITILIIVFGAFAFANVVKGYI